MLMFWRRGKSTKDRSTPANTAKKTVTMNVDLETFKKFKFWCWSTGRKVSPQVQVLMQDATKHKRKGSS